MSKSIKIFARLALIYLGIKAVSKVIDDYKETQEVFDSADITPESIRKAASHNKDISDTERGECIYHAMKMYNSARKCISPKACKEQLTLLSKYLDILQCGNAGTIRADLVYRSRLEHDLEQERRHEEKMRAYESLGSTMANVVFDLI